MALNKIKILTFEVGDEMCHFLAPRMIFWGPMGTKTCLLPKLDQICFAGHFLSYNTIYVLSFEIGDEICHF